jgi:SAM-dependent methyltransferase
MNLIARIRKTFVANDIRGHLDQCNAAGVTGWVAADNTGAPLQVEIFADGVRVLHIAAETYREDLAAAGIGDGRHGFKTSLPRHLYDGREHTIEAREASSGTPLGGSPRTFRAAAPVRGSFDQCDAVVVKGWVSNDPAGQPLTVEIFADGTLISRVLADVHRGDLAAAGIGDGRHGFRFSLPEKLYDGQEHTIEIRESATGTLLSGSPRIFRATTRAMSPDEIDRQLKALSPGVPWAHLFEFSPGVFSVTADSEQFFRKASGLKQVGSLLVRIAELHAKGHTLQGARVLDLACGEGGHSVEFAKRGAKVLGIEGRTLYMERARFAARAMGHPEIEFMQADIRKIDPQLGRFDIVLLSGILHHLGVDDFDGMLEKLGRLTQDLLLIYTHVSSDLSVKNHKLQGPVRTARGREGYLFREHKDNASTEQRVQQVRASLDNTFSFWAREEVLIEALQSSGFAIILKVMAPHVFGWEGASYRPIIVAKKDGHVGS